MFPHRASRVASFEACSGVCVNASKKYLLCVASVNKFFAAILHRAPLLVTSPGPPPRAAAAPLPPACSKRPWGAQVTSLAGTCPVATAGTYSGAAPHHTQKQSTNVKEENICIHSGVHQLAARHGP